jgi:hypothetical protein
MNLMKSNAGTPAINLLVSKTGIEGGEKRATGM